jgi:membrane dipeptidase
MCQIARFYQAVKTSRAPAIASHSSCRHFTPGFERNVSDDMIRLISEKGGVVMINFWFIIFN